MSLKSYKVSFRIIAASVLLILAIAAWMQTPAVYAAPGGGGGAGDTYDQCASAMVTSDGDRATCTKINQKGSCSTGKVFAPDKKCLTTLPKVYADQGTLRRGFQIVFGVAAGVALLSLAISAFNFATAATDAEKISRSKKAIIFALIGLVITLSAEAIVTTVIGKV